jgi:TolB-like protein/DNA-binding winged helix-turn-helix (wHTH) protein
MQGTKGAGAIVSPFPEAAPGMGRPSRKGAEFLPKRVAIRGAEADLDRGRIRAPDGTVTELRAQSAHVLAALVERRGEIVGKEELHAAVWGDIAVTEDSLVQCIGDIRRALGSARDALTTAPRRGYSLEPEIAVPSPAPAAVPAGRSRRLLFAALAAVVAALAAVWTWTASPPTPPARGPVVAVLPFANGSGGERWDRLAQGLTEDVIADLAQNAWLFVLADATTRSYARKPPAEIADELGVGYLVEGGVQAGDGEVRVTAVLVEASSGRQLWSKEWRAPEGDTLRLQRQAAEALAAELASSWSGPIARADVARARGMGTDNLTAYELARLGIEHGHRFTPEDARRAVALFERAVRLDPGYGDAWAYLSWALPYLIVPGTSDEEAERIWLARDDAALRAYRAAPDLPKPLIQAARVVGRQDGAKAERMLRRAAALAPSNADMPAYAAGQADWAPAIAVDAEAWLRRAMELNPAYPDWYQWSLGSVLFAQARYREAAEAYERGPDFVDVHASVAASRALAGDADAAAAALERAVAAEPSFAIDWFHEVARMDEGLWEALARGLRLAGAPESRGFAGK